MAIRNSKPQPFRPHGCTDATDGTNVFPGAMALLANLIPDTTQIDTWVPRPAATQLTAFGSLTTPGFRSGLLVVGDIAYGMIASGLNAGFDQPFAYNLLTGVFESVSGINSGNVPVSPPSTGPWTPPILCQVGSRIIVCHPGFPGGATKFGWFDVSGFSESTTGDTNTSNLITGNPAILGVQPGMTITGAGIPANTTVVSTANFVLVTTGNTHTNTTLDTLGSTTGLAVGQTVAGSGIPVGTVIQALPGGGVVTLSQAATATATITVTFGGATITMSAATAGSSNGVTLTIAGGTATAPLWGAGDTDRNNLPSVPLGVAQFNGRAYFVLGVNGIVYSDSGFPCRVSNTLAVQALTTNDGLACTAIGPLMLSAPLTGGIVQALIVFEDSAKMQQITGDQATANLSMNLLPVATGTSAPLSIFSCELGTGFVSPQGLRIVNFAGQISAPVGDAGTGITTPFIFSAVPSRICAAANVDTIRITSQNGHISYQPVQDWWYDITRQVWFGSHTFNASLIQPWRYTFVVSPILAGGPGLWQSDALQSLTSTYVENNAMLTCVYQTSLLPDSAEAAMNALVESTLSIALPSGATATISFTDDVPIVQDTVTITGGGVPSIYGQAVYGQNIYGGQGAAFRQRRLSWHIPLVFKQGQFTVTAPAGYPLRIGNMYLRTEILRYLEEYA